MTRIAPFAQQQLILQQVLNIQARTYDAQVQIATDKKSQDYAGIAKDSARLISLETTRNRTEQFLSNIQVQDQRIQLIDLGLETLDTAARDMRNILDSALTSPAAFEGDLANLAANTRQLVLDVLNSRDGNRYLFGGTRSDTRPVSLDPPGYRPVGLIESDGVTVDSTFYEAYYEDVLGNTLPFAAGSFYEQIYFDKNGVAPAGPLPADPDNPTLTEFVAEDPALWNYYVDRLNSAQMLANPKLDYYQGDFSVQAARVDDSTTVQIEARADAIEIQQLITALDAIANLPNADSRDPFAREVIVQARDMLNSILGTDASDGIDGLDGLRVRANAARVTLEQIRERLSSFDAFVEGTINDIENIDRNEVLLKLQNDQFVLEASFTTLARLQSLSLLEYI
ncbi:MAG: hypothetical protein QNI94_14095 [Kiloniellales bacterium]|nr:hypothetical protein [Kiloniellales bacterium]